MSKHCTCMVCTDFIKQKDDEIKCLLKIHEANDDEITRLKSLLALPVNQTVVDNQRLRDALEELRDETEDNDDPFANRLWSIADKALSGKE